MCFPTRSLWRTVEPLCSNIKASRLLNPVAVNRLYSYAEKAAAVVCTQRIRKVCFVEFKIRMNLLETNNEKI